MTTMELIHPDSSINAETSRALRVAIVSAGELYGGVERFISTFAAFVRSERAADVGVYLFSDGELAKQLRLMGVRVSISPYTGRFDPRQIGWLARRLTSDRMNVVHAHGYKASVLAGMAARRAGVPAIKTEHGAMEPFRGFAQLKMKGYLALDRFLTERHFEEVVYITSDLMQRRLWCGRRGARVIHNGISPVSAAGGLRSAGFGDGKFDIGVVGRLSPVKGHAILFDAVAKSASRDAIRLHVFGDGPLRSSLEGKARAAGLDVAFWGFRRDVLDLMTQLRCLAMPSFNEGLPYTLLEAMHLGLPILASRVGGMREILSDGVNALLVEAGDIPGLSQRIDELVESEDLQAALAAGARKTALEKFGIAPMAQSYLTLYREVCRS